MKQILFALLFALQPLTAEELIHAQTTHQMLFEKNPLTYTATVGSLPARQDQKEKTGDIHYIYYKKEGEESTAARPITFAFNGGPGSSSVWLHLGAFGPKRIRNPEEGQSRVPPYSLVDNPDSILDLTDIVFIDPIGTGFSRPSKTEECSSFFSMAGDIESLGDFIRDFITREGRWNSPKYLAGESYGALRACGLSNYLCLRHQLFLNGLILVSAAIDYKTFKFARDNELPYSLFLPSFAATAWYHGRLPGFTLNEAVSHAREFALDAFATELLRKGSVPTRLYGEIAAWTGLPFYVVEQECGLISNRTYFNHFGAAERKSVGRFDSRCIGERLPGSDECEFNDPSYHNITGIVTAALNDYLYYHLNCKAEWPRYEILSFDVNRQWSFDTFGYPSQLEELRQTLLANPEMKIFAACGYFDLATPFATVEYCLNRLHLPCENNVSFGYYEGGHMFYTNPAALKQFKADLTEFYRP